MSLVLSHTNFTQNVYGMDNCCGKSGYPQKLQYQTKTIPMHNLQIQWDVSFYFWPSALLKGEQ